MEDLSGDRILVVDDDDNIRQIVQLCLSDEGYRVRDAPNGEAALEMLGNFDPELILLDLRMPVMNGWEFARRYRTRPGPHAPIVAFVAALNAKEECAGLETVAILSKPFDLDDLLAAVRAQLPLVR
ncbi:MAG: response regulator [Chloroflexi bacterium]|nr:response regulator [Chloroflexota bacterium]MBV9603192.1 response regulator [Chloroflexota bacterium]